MPAGQVARRPRRAAPARRSGRGKAGPLASGAAPAAAFAVVAAAAAALFSLRKRSDHLQRRAALDRAKLDELLARPLTFSEHGSCRMDCRHISTAEVVQSLRTGSVNEGKSELDLMPCPKVVVDARVGLPSKRVQNVFSACPAFTQVVTVIDLNTSWHCVCP